MELNEKENQLLNREISEISLRQDGKLRCLFNPRDPVFELEEETLMPTEEEKVQIVEQAKETGVGLMCNTCCISVSSIKKLRFCQFCAQANCIQC
jgi:hypothetical protein